MQHHGPCAFCGFLANVNSRYAVARPSIVCRLSVLPTQAVEFLPAALRAAQICRYLVYSEADFEVFRPAGAYPLRDFHKICRVCTTFQDALGVKIWLDLLKGYGVMGVLS